MKKFDVIIVGGGISGMSTAARLQTNKISTLVIEAHGQVGGCAGFFKKKGFSFDVGATTLVDFTNNGVGDELLSCVGIKNFDYNLIMGYTAWLPDRSVHLYQNDEKWRKERLNKLGNSSNHIKFWKFIDKLSSIFWEVSRGGIKLPIQNLKDLVRAVKLLKIRNIYLVKYLMWTMEDAFKKFNLENDKPLRGFIAMLVEDTVHSTLDQAPLINACMGITIRDAGLIRAKGGMSGYWDNFSKHYQKIGGELKRGHTVKKITGIEGNFIVETNKRLFYSDQIISAIPAIITSNIAPQKVKERIERKIKRDEKSTGGAMVLFLGVPDDEVSGQKFIYHQLLFDYDKPLGNGNNMFISISEKDDTKSAPIGMRSVMISTHCGLEEWQGLEEEEYIIKKEKYKKLLIDNARTIYPRLGKNAVVSEFGTPITYERYTKRPNGAIGGYKQTLKNTNQFALPHNIGIHGFYLVGDSTWPGLGTVAGVLGSRIVAEIVSDNYHKILRSKK